MAVKGYVAIGHGITNKGVYDPGAVNRKLGLVEHEICAKVCTSIALGLKRSGVTGVRFEQDTPNAHDPDYIGSVSIANKIGAEWAIEFHMNAGGGKGAEAFVHSGRPESKRLATDIMRYLGALVGVHGSAVKVNDSFYFPRGTKMPSAIIEGDFVDGPNAKAIARNEAAWCANVGEMIAQGLCRFMKVRYKPR